VLAATVDGGGLTRESCRRDSGHYFDSGLVGEKESKEGNAFKGSGRGTGGQGKRTAAVCGRGASARHCARKKAGEQGAKKGQR
jgi:hypothetical protein